MWFLFLSLVGGLGFLFGIMQLVTGDQWLDQGSPWLPILLFVFLLALGVGLVRSGRKDGPELLQFVERVLHTESSDQRAA
jgi:hypothetical protein